MLEAHELLQKQVSILQPKLFHFKYLVLFCCFCELAKEVMRG